MPRVLNIRGGLMKSRRKGKTGELELAHLLRDNLGENVLRNLNQVRDGGHDLKLGLWSIEVKRACQPRLSEWWSQAVEQTTVGKPCLAYRLDRKSWRFVVALGDVVQSFEASPRTLDLTLD